MNIAKTAMKLGFGFLTAFAAMTAAGDATSQTAPTPAAVPTAGGLAAVYGNVPKDQAETVVTGDKIIAVAASGSMTAIWETLEFSEKVECLTCIPSVEPLMYDANPKTREIAAWWLRRRALGVFGPGETYERTTKTLAQDPSALKRAYAASALGEFLVASGIPLVAHALTVDADAGVRAAAALALGRLNDDGAGALGQAFADTDAGVKVAALGAATRVNTFGDVAKATALLGDPSALVRRRALELLDVMKAKDSVAGVMAVAKSDPDESVRMAACHALGAFGDASAQATLSAIGANDPSLLVRDHAIIALRRL